MRTNPEISLTCPACGRAGNDCVDTRHTLNGLNYTTRRRKCHSCGHRYSTLELTIDVLRHLVHGKGRTESKLVTLITSFDEGRTQ